MENTKILVVDDDKNINELLRLYLEKEGFSVAQAYDGNEAVKLFGEFQPDLVLLDIMLPGMDGWQVCREIRKKSDKPVIMVTAKGETFDKVLGLELGADDYVVKPFDSKEVVARIKAVLRRYSNKSSDTEKEVRFENLVVNLTNYELKVNGKTIDTPPKNWNCSIILRATQTASIPVTSCSMRFGDSNISAIREQ
jgi:Response regulator receiver domain.